jgi:glutaminyl-tRNA synthetase
MSENNPKAQITNFIWNIIDQDLKDQKWEGVATRFPPEPNGYPHIGHATSICLNFGTAKKYGGHCNLRFDDTNPENEDIEYIEAFKEDIQWLGFNWGEGLYHASDYFEKLYELAIQLIKSGDAYVDSQSVEEIRENRGNFTTPGKNSAYRDRSVEENLELFQKMRGGEFKDGEHVLRAKIDMTASNMNMRDPIMYRIKHVSHPLAGDKWCIYPMYDWTHGLSDAFEGITHSLCTLEFQDHRPLYDWYIEKLGLKHHPQQIEFAKSALNYTMTSKRRLKRLVEEKFVGGWDDPRMPTIRGMRRLGYTPESIRNFCDIIGVSKKDTIVDMSILEDCLRNDLNAKALRRMAILNPLKVTLTNYDDSVELDVANHPQKPELGKRKVAFTKTLFIEQDDFKIDANRKFFRLKPGGEVRLRGSYIIKCDEYVQNDHGEVVELKCSIDPETLGKNPEGRKVKGVIHWVSATENLEAEVRIYDRLFRVENPLKVEEGQDFIENLNPNSLEVKTALVEKSLAEAQPEEHFQFERIGYFCADRYEHSKDKLVFNRSVTLRDSWAKEK